MSEAKSDQKPPYRCPQDGDIGGHTYDCHTETHHTWPPGSCICNASDQPSMAE